ncbi:hypothetical protein LTR04_000014, partial [Oleoguttula sp. CCFEE 6159]
MARRTVASDQHDATHSSRTNGDVPPSTIAAQIVQNHSHANGRRHVEDKTTFGQLLQEILGVSAAVEKDIEVNYKLIAVVAEAGLDVLTRDDPFAPMISLIPQARDSIKVIEKTIRRNPGILLYTGGPPDGSLDKPQLYQWLLPKVFSLLGRSRCEAIQEALQGLLSSCVYSLLRTIDMWQRADALIQILQDSVDNSDLVTTKSSASFSVALPPSRSITNLGQNEQQLLVIPQGYQVHVHDPVQSLVIALSLLAVIVNPAEDISQVLCATSSPNNMGWISESCNGLWRTSESLRTLPSCDDDSFQRAFLSLAVDESQANPIEQGRPRKRRKLAEIVQKHVDFKVSESKATKINRILTESIGVHERPGEGIEGTEDSYAKLSEEDRFAALEAIAKIPCEASSCLYEESDLQNDPIRTRCSVCDMRKKASDQSKAWGKGEHRDHCVGSAALGQWCLKSLHSSLRELRIAAGRTLSAYLRDDLPEELRRKNRVLALNFLKALSDRNDLGEQETLIMAWGQVAAVSGDEVLNIILLRLIDFLGHSNPLISGLAFDELSQLSTTLNQKPEVLLRPFWRSIGITVLKDLQTRPQKAQHLSDWLDMSVNQFLLLTQTETLPYLVLTKKGHVLQRIAAARGGDTTVLDLCMQPRTNLAAILALLFLQPSPDVERFALNTFCEVVPKLSESDLLGLMKLEATLIACEMLKAAGDEDSSRKPKVRSGKVCAVETWAYLSQVHQAIQSFVSLTMQKGGLSKGASKQNRLLASFFDQHVLGIMAHFSDIIGDGLVIQPTAEKKRSLRAIEEMINIAKTHVSIALPQSALDVPDLRDQAFSAWAALIIHLASDDIALVMDHTFAVIAQNWVFFDPTSQQLAHATVAHLLKNHSTIVRDAIHTLPSLASIPLMSKFSSEIARLKASMHMNSHCQAFSQRCEDENAAVVVQALHELVSWLEKNQQFIHESAVSEQPSPVVGKLTRSVLDACIRFAEDRADIVSLCTQALGMIGCLDPNRVEATRHKRDILVKSNFDRADEVIDFVAFFLERVLVKAFHSVTNARAQGFLAYVMQELLKSCGFDKVATYRPGGSQSNSSYQRWMEIPSTVRSTLTPFLSSRYVLTTSTTTPAPRNYPIFSTKFSHSAWLRAFVFDLLQRGTGVNAKMIFPVLARIIRGHDISISIFLLPFAALNVTVGGTDGEAKDVGKELLTVLEHQGQGAGQFETTKACSENVFQVLDYLSRWMQEKNKELAHMRNVAARMGQSPPELEELTLVKQISSVERVLSGIPAEVIARRAVECGSYARALFHWEQYVRQQKKIASDRGEAANEEFLYQRLQDIYTQIDEPDGIEGISTHLHVLDPDQQVLDHRKAGRWTAAQSWYELELATKPDDVDAQMNLLTCLRESGQFNALLKYVESSDIAPTRSVPQVLSFASEASWMTEKFDLLRKHVAKPSEIMPQDFNVGIGKAMVKILENDQPGFQTALSSLREGVAKGFSTSNTSSLQTCHDHMLKLHTLYEIESLSGLANTQAADPDRAFDWESLDRRLAILGSYMPDKQYLLGVRRAVMEISKLHISELDRASSWLTSARLARKAGLTNTAFNAVLHATQLGDDSAKIEHSRLLWKDGHHRKAIQNLEGAIAVNAFRSHDRGVVAEASHAEDKQQQQNMLTARAHLLLAKWLDTAGQTQSQVITNKYQFAAKTNARWDKGHYYLGKHYNKLLESEKALPRARQSMSFLCGETAKLVIDNYMRSLAFGSKYWYQTVPKILTLWLELGMDVHNASRPAAPDVGIADQRIRILDLVHRQLRKYVDRLPAYIFYTALPQIISRISHPNMKVYEVLSTIILKIVSTHPSQALWSLLAVDAKRNKSEAASLELRNMIAHGQKLSDHLLQACEVHIESRASTVSLSKDLGFSHRLAPSTLVIPIESTLTATLPTVHNSDYIRRYKAFPQDRVTISSFSDDVLVLASLQRPRKLTVRGSDGKNYGLLCKPKDDLRKDQRLMEFNAMINRALKRDAESSKRRLYIKTYGVTPLSEESGTIEWVDHIKPMRDILLKLYARKGVTPNYNELRTLLTEASADPQNVAIFTEKVLPQFPPALHEYFVETFPEPEAWFAARLRYARTCAVMSMVGHVLGLGDRHGENILLEESTGGVFHVDFNCLFDKGLTFEKPELVPFRLTHNMVDAMGAYGYEGPFRKSAELTMEILRQNEETLMTILETFVYDPTTDFVGKKKRPTPGVPDTPQEVLESVRSKLRGLLKGESVPLSVEGH